MPFDNQFLVVFTGQLVGIGDGLDDFSGSFGRIAGSDPIRFDSLSAVLLLIIEREDQTVEILLVMGYLAESSDNMGIKAIGADLPGPAERDVSFGDT
ncbi:hypothetical protein A2276_04420 [candidate division WOR-1 bacterium RIFOXYA12_FULL_43_27]|uniref:Uncharacterized protein n=1 Tax=candidate division WOR-1 bacterium RIFOXYC2_FULL_46_14 TaxID=1802587 RepID=A0A1F4U415_UNCSA|nr:MAG: hypothetical protein A2276_04420 [candidate division WOR-1 bacterium RIFOXYA12_FULL_43_27]OGC18926.1 MAG: hypothetical protein A2292_08415 [candidate division WOR-1 bacterium RIFOXYB2_FULL_46_45]OGC29067.1 MAG: hypothetical protein A2232_03480 [candidate division WOR-1 bacterium RIFOXYA2_FULL_46_56]OGC39686.1 MAG: hypothetical protein A2438_06870 [candidate division WOR-1 bacterium RIFOXYC2_FULL_46_14]